MSVKWNLYAELNADNEALRERLHESTGNGLNQLAAAFVLLLNGVVLWAYLQTDERGDITMAALCLIGLFFWCFLWREWQTGLILVSSAKLSNWRRLVKVLEPPLLMGLIVWVILWLKVFPQIQWLSAVWAAALAYLAQVWAYDRFLRKNLTAEEYAQRQGNDQDGGRPLRLLAVLTLAATLVVCIWPEMYLPGAKPWRTTQHINTIVENLRSAETIAWHYEDKLWQLEYCQLGQEKLLVYYDRSGERLQGAYWEQSPTGEKRWYDGGLWRDRAAPKGWPTELPQPLLINKVRLGDGAFGDFFYQVSLTEADLQKQEASWAQLETYEQITAKYLLRKNVALTYYVEAYGRDKDVIPETLYHGLVLKSTEPQIVADLLAQQKKELFWPEEENI